MTFTPFRASFSIGSVIALLVLLIAILGLLDVVPLSPHMVFGLFAALSAAVLL